MIVVKPLGNLGSGAALSLDPYASKLSAQLGPSLPPTDASGPIDAKIASFIPATVNTLLQKSIVTSILPSMQLPLISPLMTTKMQPLATTAASSSPVKTLDPFDVFTEVAKASGGAPSAYEGTFIDAKAIQAPGLPSSLDPGSITQSLPQQAGPPGPGSVASHEDPGSLSPTDQAALNASRASAPMQKQQFSCFSTWWCPALIVTGVVAVGYMVLKK